ncbi:ACT domain-containing protein [Stakelama sp. CBK3Z-3]|uniref:ACT domain-containing protein n=1 Tax=Stakelama flava TaxID=2860338 RepID=A0ABS6XNT8_9SPHN|nr:ACT domain-containing protein [Stakelama flava]MBW4331882.1 ACT domain-containing protein [Stakelama flava]
MAVRETAAMIAAMEPALQPGEYVFATFADPQAASAFAAFASGSFREAEGVSLILPTDRAQGLACSPPMRCITLTVHSALDGVGLTAAVSGALARHDIAANMVAAYHHDHVFVPTADAEAALAVLQALQRDGRSGGEL